MFCQSKHICASNQNTFVFCHMPDNCYHICTYCQQIIVSTMKDYLPPHRPPPLTLSAPRWRHRHRCHGCRAVAHIATITIATALQDVCGHIRGDGGTVLSEGDNSPTAKTTASKGVRHTRRIRGRRRPPSRQKEISRRCEQG